MKRFITTSALSLGLLVGIVALGATTVACKEPTQQTAAEETVVAQNTVVATDTVEVKKDGNEFNPKIAVSQLPDGAWYCDMGGVHYARMDKGDGKCASCGMKLNQKGGSEDEANHDHDDHDHH